MNKKGFTLIELLAVIVILAIIALIATPIILGIINNTKDSSNKRSVELYAKAVENAVARYQISNPSQLVSGTFTSNEDGTKLTLGDKVLEVEYDGNVACNDVQIDEKGKVELKNCKVNGEEVDYIYSNGVVEDTNNPGSDSTGGSDNPTGGQEPQVNYFSQDSWEQIVSNVQNGNTSRYSVGDTKTITLTSDDTEISGTYTVRIANKSTPAECSTEGFSQSACGFVIEFVDVITRHVMNSNPINAGGWLASLMRTYVNNDIYNALPPELKAEGVILPTTVVSGHGYNDAPNIVSTDKLYLLSTAEVYQGGLSGDSAKHLSRQLDYYEGVTINSFTKATKYDSDESEVAWWLRSASSNTIDFFYLVMTGGAWIDSYATAPLGISPAFRIG